MNIFQRTRALFVCAVVVASVCTVASRDVTTAAAAGTGAVLPVVDTNYAIPAGAYFVSNSGADTNVGSKSAPLATLGRALATAPAGATIVMRGGTYRESINSIYKRVTIQAYPHEQVWLDGRLIVTGWTTSGSRWVRADWNPGLCETCFDPAAILSSAPAAGSPDQVFIDGVPQAQVLSLTAVTPGKFFLDNVTHALYLGSDPTGHVVLATAFAKAMQFNTSGSTGSIVRGIGFIGYGPNWNSGTNLAMVIAAAPGITFENDTFAFSASRGLAMLTTSGVVRGSTFINNGYQGLVADNADGLTVDASNFSYNNAEHFVNALSSVNGAAGAKITSTKNIVVRDSIFEDNDSSGLWFDLSSQNVTVVRNLLQRNAVNGLYAEVSDTVLLASNVAVENTALGIKVSGSSNVRVWNNTLANNGGSQLGVYEDPRSNTNAAEIALGLTWNTANVALENNIFAFDRAASTAPLVATADVNSPKRYTASQMITVTDHSVYARAVATVPGDQAFWCNLTASAYGTHYTTLASFRTGTGREAAGVEVRNYVTSTLFTDANSGNYRLRAGSPATGNGRPLPADIATAVGVPAGAAVDRGALSWPTGTSVTTLATPVYGLWNHTTGDRIYTTSSAEVNNAITIGYAYTGVAFRASSASTTALVPIYRLFSPLGEHLYTPWATERDKLVVAGWTLQLTAFYASPTQKPGLTQVYRMYDTVTRDHWLSTNPTPPAGSVLEVPLFWAGT